MMTNLFANRTAYLLAVPVTGIIVALYGTVMPFGAWGYVGGAAAGLGWAVLLGSASERLQRQTTRAVFSANCSVFAAIIAMGLLLGGGLMYRSLFNAVLDEPSTTYAVLSAMMRPTIPYFIIVNSAMELFIVPLAMFLNWHADPRRKRLVACATLIYLAMRIWTYLFYAGQRLATGTHPLIEADVVWFRQTLANDFRFILNALALVLFTLAAFMRPRQNA